MAAAPNAVELTVDQAWFIAETVGAGTFPWVLAITTPYTDAGERGAFIDRQAAELTRLGMMSASGDVNPAVADWIRQVCFPDRWLDLRYVGSGPDLRCRRAAARDHRAARRSNPKNYCCAA